MTVNINCPGRGKKNTQGRLWFFHRELINNRDKCMPSWFQSYSAFFKGTVFLKMVDEKGVFFLPKIVIYCVTVWRIRYIKKGACLNIFSLLSFLLTPLLSSHQGGVEENLWRLTWLRPFSLLTATRIKREKRSRKSKMIPLRTKSVWCFPTCFFFSSEETSSFRIVDWNLIKIRWETGVNLVECVCNLARQSYRRRGKSTKCCSFLCIRFSWSQKVIICFVQVNKATMLNGWVLQ